MATTTPNFGFDIPQSTDLVKDGATAIAALGTDIDTAFVDLKGGTTGQVLAKASGTDLDFSWVAQDDSNAIQNAIVDAKGDLIGATAADTPARLAVGTNGQVLTADSAEATGLKWATPATPSSGLTFISKVDFTSSTAVNINSVFSSTYNAYRIVGNYASTTTTQGDCSMRLRASGTDTTANYTMQRFYANGTSSGAGKDTLGTDEWFMGGNSRSGVGKAAVSFDLVNPNVADTTQIINSMSSNFNLTDPQFDLIAGSQTGSTQFDGFSYLFSQSSTGTFYIYGYQKA
jgi:hypothetical protein